MIADMSENASVFKIASILNISGYSAEVITHMLYPAFVTVVDFRHNMHECVLLTVLWIRVELQSRVLLFVYV